MAGWAGLARQVLCPLQALARAVALSPAQSRCDSSEKRSALLHGMIGGEWAPVRPPAPGRAPCAISERLLAPGGGFLDRTAPRRVVGGRVARPPLPAGRLTDRPAWTAAGPRVALRQAPLSRRARRRLRPRMNHARGTVGVLRRPAERFLRRGAALERSPLRWARRRLHQKVSREPCGAPARSPSASAYVARAALASPALSGQARL